MFNNLSNQPGVCQSVRAVHRLKVVRLINFTPFEIFLWYLVGMYIRYLVVIYRVKIVCQIEGLRGQKIIDL